MKVLVAAALLFAASAAGDSAVGGGGGAKSAAAAGKSGKSDKSEDASKRPPADAFTGISVAAHATDIYGPEAGFSISGWNSWWHASKLVELAPDGTAVKAGDVVARFDFRGKDALSWIQQRISSAEAKAASAKIDAQQTVDGLRLDEKKKEIEAQLARIDVEKERALSRRQAEIYRISKEIADFEVDAAKQRIASAERANEAEKAYQDLTVKRAHSDMDTYHFYEDRFVVHAPHDGVVRHAFNGRERRKVQKGDSIAGGTKVMSVAKDSALAVRFFVPEYRIHELSVGSAVVVTTQGSREEHRATVSSIDYFPQEIGYLLENDDLPNAREKAFAVSADFDESPKALSAGTELVVRLPSSAAPQALPADAPGQPRPRPRGTP